MDATTNYSRKIQYVRGLEDALYALIVENRELKTKCEEITHAISNNANRIAHLQEELAKSR